MSETTAMLSLSDSNDETGYDATILFLWRDATDVLEDHGYVLSASFFEFLFVLVFCFGQILWLFACGSNYLKTQHTGLWNSWQASTSCFCFISTLTQLCSMVIPLCLVVARAR
jgi:hypothetical protein